ncbi:hypothetical protein MTQ94_11505 [Staphylococcus agnetis]|uniref:hypothetical protein n=1 Tax=Staphylococcus TaxID=1279 RepID=UPI0011898D97|nr:MULTISPECIES: hypothetical protein [Staphylococcus]MCO4330275.1 hypothetical protein [Staphylococcus hyicus]MCO4332593.1 hypothetical protein [Staphylococcus hyicus]MCO4333727.1 hypothetical protein [Staphylococcus hyicus]MCO4334412.1 hypothetical protein [Staphylococcus hyicus]MCO4335821.1 hypothetical protein [Staphylococcus hyicus]
MIKRIKRLQQDTLIYLDKNLSQRQRELKKSIDESTSESKLSYAEINEVLYLIDREQQYLANHRC